MKKQTATLASAGMILLGLALIYFGSLRAVTLFVDGRPLVLHSRALFAGQVLNQAGVPLGPADRVFPQPDSFLGWSPVIVVERASQVQLFSPAGLSLPVLSQNRLAANLLLAAGARLFPNDRIYWNGQPLEPSAPLPPAAVYTLQLQPAAPLTLTEDGQARSIYSSAPDLAGALWDAGIHPSYVDDISAPLDSLLGSSNAVRYTRAVPVTIDLDGRELTARSAGQTVGQALADAGVALQGADYSIPGEGEPVPTDGPIQVVRVREEVQLKQTTVPYTTEYVDDPNTDLDQKSIVQPGQYGIQVSRVRVRYENGQEISRQTEDEWTASEPKAQVVGRGTKVAIKTLDTPSGKIKYWRAMTVYATSYSPCNSGGDRCYSGTSLGLPVKRGVIAVTKEWYRQLAGAQVYIPGYGTAVIADIGGGIPGTRWIDLGFSDENFEAWHQNVTIYFLTPAPATVPTLP